MNLPECLPSLFKIDKETLGNKLTLNGIWLVLKEEVHRPQHAWMIRLWNTIFFLKLLLIPPADFLWKHFGWDSRRISVFFEIQCKQMATKLLVLSKKKTFLEFFGFPKFVSYYRLFDTVTILFLLRIGQNCKYVAVHRKTLEYGNCRGTYRLAVF